MLPKTGDTVTLTVHYDLPLVPDRVITGCVLPAPRWLRSSEIALSSHTALDGMAVVDWAHVVGWRDHNGVAQPLPTTKTLPDTSWQVQGSKGTTYTVTRKSQVMRCTCPGFNFRGKCRHVEAVA
jgi:hypothetical protein